MAKNKMGLKFEGWDEYMAKLDELGGSGAMKRGVEAGLKASKSYVNPLINKAVTTPNLPAGGKYGSGADVRAAIDQELKVEWDGMTGEINIGFTFENIGLLSIYLIYGTPKMSPAKGLKAAIYGAKTQKEVARIQQEALSKVIKRIMEG